MPTNIPSGAPPTYVEMTDGTRSYKPGGLWIPLEVTAADVWPSGSAPGDRKTLHWFPSQRAAESWKRYMTNNGMLP